MMNKLIIAFFIIILIKSSFAFGDTKWITKKKSENKILGFCSQSMSISSLNLEADKFYNDNNYDESFKCSLIAANKGDSYAQGNIGWLYHTGNGVEKDDKKAIKWLRLAVKQGSSYALTQLAKHYSNGWGIAKDHKKAFELNMEAAHKNDAYAQAKIGYHYQWGEGIEKNYKLAIQWYIRAANQENTFAQANLGWMIAEGKGAEKNYKKGFEWSLKAAKKENDFAQSNVGWHYENGFGVVKDIEKAIMWYESAAKQGNEFAENKLKNLLPAKNENKKNLFITKKTKKTNEDSSLISSDWITKKRIQESEKKKNIKENKTNVQINEISIDEGWLVVKTTKIRKNHNVESKSLGKIFTGEQAWVLKKYIKENEDWFYIETENGVVGYVLANKLKSFDQMSPPPKKDWGNYYALVIGNNNYDNWSKLSTAVNDAEHIAKILEEKYNFKITYPPSSLYTGDSTLLIDKGYEEISNAIFEFRDTLGPNDNLLVYYAGHGYLDNEENQGYWIPIDAKLKQRSNWINNTYILNNLKVAKAKHILVVADSCFAASLQRGLEEEIISDKELDILLKKKTRLIVTSGGNKPVLDKGVNNHSYFAYAIIQKLKTNDETILISSLFPGIRRYVLDNIPPNFEQTPELAKLKNTGHDGGDFIFVPKKYHN